MSEIWRFSLYLEDWKTRLRCNSLSCVFSILRRRKGNSSPVSSLAQVSCLTM